MYFKHRLANLFYEKVGDSSQVMMILPGWGNTRSTFQFILNHFKDNYTIYIFDYPGFGNSPPIRHTLKMEDYAMIIKDFMDEHKINKPIILSHSFGGRITAILSGRYHIPIDKIVLIDVAGIKRKKIIMFFKTTLYKILKKYCTFFHQQSLLMKVRRYFSSQDYQDVPPFMSQTFQNIVREDLRKDYQNIQSDVLILWGENDQDTPLKDGYYLHKHIKDSGFILYPRVGHFSYLEKSSFTLQILDAFFIEKDMD
ncbi:MAG: alpha/beta hydrolase [Bacilli bacterium]|nr:alpha/beta hydrolase [Bacilli bacterium]